MRKLKIKKTKWYLVKATEDGYAYVIPREFRTWSEAFRYSSERKLMFNGFTGIKGKDILNLKRLKVKILK